MEKHPDAYSKMQKFYFEREVGSPLVPRQEREVEPQMHECNLVAFLFWQGRLIIKTTPTKT